MVELGGGAAIVGAVRHGRTRRREEQRQTGVKHTNGIVCNNNCIASREDCVITHGLREKVMRFGAADRFCIVWRIRDQFQLRAERSHG